MPIFVDRSDQGQPRYSHARCDNHKQIPGPLNGKAEGGECPICVSDELAGNLTASLVEKYDRALALYQEVHARAVTRMDLLSPGAGTQFAEEVVEDLKAMLLELADSQISVPTSGQPPASDQPPPEPPKVN